MIDYNTSFYHKLHDETEVFFRQIKPEDKVRLQEGLKYLSDESIYTRFFSPVRRLTNKQLDYLTNADQKNHIAWGVMCPTYPEMPGLGTCRFFRTPEKPEEAEFAITIVDEFQNRGLGTEFLALIYVLASYHGIKKLIGSALYSNLALVKRFRQIGAKVIWKKGSCDIFLPVYSDFSDFPVTKYSKIFIKMLKIFKQKLEK